MADNLPQNDTQHFNKLFWFCVISALVGVVFLICLCYFPVPKASERFADNVQGFIEGTVVTATLSFILGGNLPIVSKKPESVTPVNNADTVNVTNNNAPPVVTP